MAHIVEEVSPKVWTEKEAYECGKGGYRIKVELSGNPFKGALAEAWEKGWKDASSSDTTSTRRIDYAAMEDRNDRRPKHYKFGEQSRGRGRRESSR